MHDQPPLLRPTPQPPASRRRRVFAHIRRALFALGVVLYLWLLIRHPMATTVTSVAIGAVALGIAVENDRIKTEERYLASLTPSELRRELKAREKERRREAARQEHIRAVRHAAFGGALCGLLLGCWLSDD